MNGADSQVNGSRDLPLDLLEDHLATQALGEGLGGLASVASTAAPSASRLTAREASNPVDRVFGHERRLGTHRPKNVTTTDTRQPTRVHALGRTGVTA